MGSLDMGPIISRLGDGYDSFGASVESAVSSLQNRLAARAGQGSTRSNLQLSLLSDSRPLIDSLLKDYPSLVSSGRKELSPEQIILSTFKQFLENSRRELLPGSPHRRKVWERLKSCADKCERHWFAEQPGISWLDTPFLSRLLEWLQTYHPEDKNLPRTLVGLEAYIFEFGNCHATLDDSELEHLIDDHWRAASGLSHQEALAECLGRLASGAPDLWEAICVKFELGRVRYLQVQHYRQEKGLSRRQYQHLLSKGLDAVRDCVDEKVRWDWDEAGWDEI